MAQKDPGLDPLSCIQVKTIICMKLGNLLNHASPLTAAAASTLLFTQHIIQFIMITVANKAHQNSL